MGSDYLMYVVLLKVGLSVEETEAVIAHKVPYISKLGISGVKIHLICNNVICSH